MIDQVSLSFLLCTLNRNDYFERSIRSLFEAENYNIRFEVIVVDQGVSRYVEKICTSLGAKYIPSESRGLSLARNIGLEKCEGQFIALMDDDAYISKNYFDHYKSIIAETWIDRINAFSGRIMTVENPQKSYSRTQSSKISRIGYDNVNIILSSALVIRKSTFVSVGGFDEDFGVGAKWGGSEETDFICRVIKNGGEVKYFPLLRVFHPEVNYSTMSFDKVIKKSYRYGLGRGAMLKKNTFLPLSFRVKAFILPAGGLALSLLCLKPKMAVKFMFTFFGRVAGFIYY